MSRDVVRHTFLSFVLSSLWRFITPPLYGGIIGEKRDRGVGGNLLQTATRR